MTLLILQKNYASDVTLMPEQNRVVLEMTVQRADELNEEAQVSKRRKKLAYYLLGGAAVGACLVGVYLYIKNSNQQAPTNNLPHQQNTPNNQVPVIHQENPQNPQVQPQNIPVQDNVQNAPPAGPNVRVRFQGVNYPDIAQDQEMAEWIFMNDLRLHNGNIDHAIRTLLNEYVAYGNHGIRLHIQYEAVDQNGLLTELDGIFP